MGKEIVTQNEVKVYSLEELRELNHQQEREAIKDKTKSSLFDIARGRLKMSKNRPYVAFLRGVYGDVKLKPNSKSYTEEDLNMFMQKNFDWFKVDGTLIEDLGKSLGTSGVSMPTTMFACCTIEQFVEVVAKKTEANWGIHRASYEATSDEDGKFPGWKLWKGKKVTKYNVHKFIVDYCEGKIARGIEGVGQLPTSTKERLLNVANGTLKAE